MEKKYYDLIIKLIKEHRKYSGLEAILEDIANDVYEHSKVVIGSITNDEVITAYLNKVVATSIVTVPKKMNFNVKTRHRIITTIIPQATEVVAPTPAVVEEAVQHEVSAKAEEVVDLDELLVEDEPILDVNVTEQEEVSFAEEVITPEIEKEPEQEAVALEEMTEVIEEELPVAAVDSIPEPEFEPEPVTSPATQVDKNLVDLMINGVPSQDSEEDILVEETLEEESSEIYESLEFVEPSEEDSLEQQDDVLSEAANDEVLELENMADETIESVEEIIEPVQSVEVIENVEEVSVEEQENLETIEELEALDDDNDSLELFEEESSLIEPEEHFDETESVLEEEGVELDAVDEIIPSQEDDVLLEEETEFDMLEEAEDLMSINDEADSLELETDTVLEIEDELNEVSTDKNVSSEGSFEVPNFNCFSYEPEKPDYDSAEILSYLIEIDEKHPERKILTICDMKYNQGLSVTEIAKTVGFTEENVIEVLNEIIDTIKD